MTGTSPISLDALPLQQTLEFIEKCYLSDHTRLTIILTDGAAISGEISSRAWGESGLLPVSETVFSRSGHLELHYGERFNVHSLYIPVEQIAGIYTLPITQRLIRGRTGDNSANSRESSYGILLEDLMSKVQDRGFPSERHHVNYFGSMTDTSLDWGNTRFSIDTSLHWGNTRFSNDAPLYSDWGYFQRKSGGLTSLGIGLPGGSVSVGWSQSLWGPFSKSTRRRAVSLDRVCLNAHVVVCGFVSLIEQIAESGELKKHVDTLDMEGANWVAAAITNRRILTARRLGQNIWSLVYLRPDGFIVPSKLWRDFVQPIRIFAEVVPANVETNAGKLTCFLKARSAAFFKDG